MVCVQSQEGDRFGPKPVHPGPTRVLGSGCAHQLSAVWAHAAATRVACPVWASPHPPAARPAGHGGLVVHSSHHRHAVQVVARTKEDILKARGVKPTLSPNLNVLATVEALNVKRLLFIGVGCQVGLPWLCSPQHLHESLAWPDLDPGAVRRPVRPCQPTAAGQAVQGIQACTGLAQTPRHGAGAGAALHRAASGPGQAVRHGHQLRGQRAPPGAAHLPAGRQQLARHRAALRVHAGRAPLPGLLAESFAQSTLPGPHEGGRASSQLDTAHTAAREAETLSALCAPRSPACVRLGPCLQLSPAVPPAGLPGAPEAPGRQL